MAQSARQGTLLLTVAQAWHALSSYVIFVSAARLLGAEAFGDFGLVVWTMTALETFVVAGTPRAVSFHVARHKRAVRVITWRGLAITATLASVLAAVLAAVAGMIGERLWDAPALVAPLRLAAIDFVAFAGFAVFVQMLNGLHLFLRQAAVWITYSTVKVAAVLALLYAVGSIEAGVLGYVIASTIASAVAMAAGWKVMSRGEAVPQAEHGDVDRDVDASSVRDGVPVAKRSSALAERSAPQRDDQPPPSADVIEAPPTGAPPVDAPIAIPASAEATATSDQTSDAHSDEPPTTAAMLRFGMPMAVHAMAMSAMLTIDLWAAKAVAADRLEAGGYVAASTLARVLYFVFIAFGEALFPAVARVYQKGAGDDAVALARDGMGLLLALLIPSVGLATGAAGPTLAAIYGDDASADAARHFADAAPFLTLLAPAAAAMTVVGVTAMLIAATQRPARVAAALLVLLGVTAAAAYGFAYPFGPLGAAGGALGATLLGAVVMTAWAGAVFGRNIIPLRNLAFALAAAALLHVTLRAWTPPGLWVLLYGGVLLGVVLAAFAAAGVLPWRGFKSKKKAAVARLQSST